MSIHTNALHYQVVNLSFQCRQGSQSKRHADAKPSDAHRRRRTELTSSLYQSFNPQRRWTTSNSRIQKKDTPHFSQHPDHSKFSHKKFIFDLQEESDEIEDDDVINKKITHFSVEDSDNDYDYDKLNRKIKDDLKKTSNAIHRTKLNTPENFRRANEKHKYERTIHRILSGKDINNIRRVENKAKKSSSGQTPVPDFSAERIRNSPNCIFLSISDQESLGLSLHRLLPYRSYARKNLGYLFAVAHGAKVIYETDDDNRPLDQLKGFNLALTTSGLMYAGERLFNPYHHFGQSTLWPRGFPLAAVGAPQENLYRLSSKWRTPGIQQGVVNGDPDMDAIFRLTRKQKSSRLQVKFDSAAPPVILPESVYSPFNSQNTLFTYEALWAMLLPTTTTFRMCDIWRGYWAQRLLWEIGSRLAFYPPNAYQQRNAHSYMDDAEDERDMYFETGRLLDFLTTWSCHYQYTFFQCVYILSVDMAKHKFWKDADIEVTRLWLEDMIRVGYLEPKRVKLSENRSRFIKNGMNNRKDNSKDILSIQATLRKNTGKSELAKRRLLSLRNGTSVYFAASQQNSPSIYTKNSHKLDQANHHAEDIASLCSNFENITLKPHNKGNTVKTYFEDILLIIVFNWPHYSNLKYLEAVYRHVFPNIAYCGGNPEKFLVESKKLNKDLTFINAPVLIGVYGYTCFIAAAQMGYNVTGYMVVGDDVLVNIWNFHGFDKNKMWSNYAVHIFDVNNGTAWSWWGFKVGEQAYKNSMDAIRKQQRRQQNYHENQKRNHRLELTNHQLEEARFRHLKSTSHITTASMFLSTLHNNTKGVSNCPHAVNDMYYIPARFAPSAVHYLSLFARNGLMLELAISMTIYGLNPRDKTEFFSGDNLWLGERLDPWRKFHSRSFFLHPVKLSNASNIQPFCSKYLTTLLSKMYQRDPHSEGVNDTFQVARKDYLERLQENYRERQDMQIAWLQQELFTMKKRKEETVQKAEQQKNHTLQDETVAESNRYQTLKKHPNLWKNKDNRQKSHLGKGKYAHHKRQLQQSQEDETLPEELETLLESKEYDTQDFQQQHSNNEQEKEVQHETQQLKQ
ncbi:conserved uncharacterized protein [Plakobranchus ocellatus]|uniref:Conserved uncharacterized protein n=1 Tax=Plakobranchus ocellatus TaxID=259542 RepID=A0AAV4A2U7_9GAST|nr:conserved uncharacterized protein [Plakobranchus ocellatus]